MNLLLSSTVPLTPTAVWMILASERSYYLSNNFAKHLSESGTNKAAKLNTGQILGVGINLQCLRSL